MKPVLITGGAGFIGANLANRLARDGIPVVIFDNLCRPAVERNLMWLARLHGGRILTMQYDIRDFEAVRRAVQSAVGVFHFAAQVAVTSSLTSPMEDFEVNTRGTLNVLEAIRTAQSPPYLVYTSTNKVYGALTDLILEGDRHHYLPPPSPIREYGINESRALQFHSPYGCSKGAAEQYVLDYAHSYGIPAVVFRMSCAYGPRQFGSEDQGWVAHFMRQAMAGRMITIYGDGRQVRDILYVDDLIDALMRVQGQMSSLSGQAFNIGGGPKRAISLLDLIQQIERIEGRSVPVSFEKWRMGDQRYYVSDTRKFQQMTGWEPKVGVEEGILRLRRWISESVQETRNARATEANA